MFRFFLALNHDHHYILLRDRLNLITDRGKSGLNSSSFLGDIAYFSINRRKFDDILNSDKQVVNAKKVKINPQLLNKGKSGMYLGVIEPIY